MSRRDGVRRLTLQMARWLIFNIVGIGGFAVQLGALALLTSGFGWPLPLATLAAVELAVLHNFFWHQRWTWRDRPSRGSSESLQRLARFHAANGLVSLVGNVLITSALVHAGMTAIPANIMATLACSLVNYFAGDLVVFRTGAVMLALLLAPATSQADQSAQALSGWDRHVASVEKRFSNPSGSFFALDAQKADRWRERARSGEVVMVEVPPPGIDNGKLHHWAGAIYVPKAKVDDVVNRLLEYAGRESEFYQEVKASKLLQRDGDRVRVYMRIFRDAGPVEATYNTEHAVEYRRLSPRATARSVSTKIAELDKPGTPAEREKKPGDDNGFLWRLNAYWRYEQLGDGVLIECESVSISRSVPLLLRPFVSGIVNSVASGSLRNTMVSLRKFLTR